MRRSLLRAVAHATSRRGRPERRRPVRGSVAAVGLVAMALTLSTLARADEPDPAAAPMPGAIRAVLEAQRQAWNAGDIEAFLEPYWKSEELSFSSGGETRRGFRATRERYLKTYPDRQAMGTLAFSDLEISAIGADAALVLGEWDLDREAGPVGGNFSLVMRRIGGRWVIVHDHTSRREKR